MYEHSMAESRSYSHVEHNDEDDDEVDSAQKQADLNDSLHLPGIHTPPHPQEPYYTHDPNLHLQGLAYNIPLSLQFQYLHPQSHLSLNCDVSHYGHQPEHMLQLQQLGSGGLPEYHDQTHSHVSQVRVPKPPRKSRWRPTPKQKERLETFWADDQYPDRKKKQTIASDLEGVSAEQVSRWFKHRRESLVQKGQFAYRSEAATKFLNEQVAHLEQVFKSNAYPSREDIKLISDQMGVSQQRVKNWFKARRCRLAQKGEFEFRQNDNVQVRPPRPFMGDRKRSKEEISSPLDESNAKRQELMPCVHDDIVDVGVDTDSQHDPDHDHTSDLPQINSLVPDHGGDLPQINSLVPEVDVVGMSSLQGPLVDHIMPKSPQHLHHHHDRLDDDHVFTTQDNHLLNDDLHRGLNMDTLKVEPMHHHHHHLIHHHHLADVNT